MARNHRGFIEAIVAVSKLGANALLLNTSFAGPQLTEVVKREKPVGIIYDEEFAELLSDAGQAAQALRGLARRGTAEGPLARGADRGGRSRATRFRRPSPGAR